MVLTYRETGKPPGLLRQLTLPDFPLEQTILTIDMKADHYPHRRMLRSLTLRQFPA